MKKILLVLIVIFSSNLLHAQVGWEKLICEDSLVYKPKDFYESPNGDILLAHDVTTHSSSLEPSVSLSWIDQDGQTLSTYDLPLGGAISQTVNKIIALDSDNFLLVGNQRVNTDSSGFSRSKIFFITVNSTGDIITNDSYGADSLLYGISDVMLTDDAVFIVGNQLHSAVDTFITAAFLMKANYDGDSIWLKDPVLDDSIIDINRGGDASEDHVYLVSDVNAKDSLLLSKVDFDGNLIQNEFFPYDGTQDDLHPRDIKIHPDGGFGLVILNSIYQVQQTIPYKEVLYKFSETLDFEWNLTIDSLTSIGLDNWSGENLVTLDENDNFQVLSVTVVLLDTLWWSSTNFSRRLLTKVDPQGTLISEIEIPTEDRRELAYTFDRLNDNGYFFGCRYSPVGGGQNCGIWVRTDENGLSLNNLLSGNIFNDENLDCEKQTLESGLGSWFVEANNGVLSYYATTDAMGDYSMLVGSGFYTVSAQARSNYWEVCDDSVVIDFVNYYDTLDFAAQVVTECPAMWVDIATPFIRNCFQNTYYVNYCNFGTVSESDATIEITLPEGLDLVNTSIPFSYLPDSTLLFEIGEVGISDCGSFTITVYADCDIIDMGQTLCTQALIFPDTICDTDSLWTGASVKVIGECINNDSLKFKIINVGSAATTIPLNYIVVEDQVIMLQDDFDLPPMDSIEIPILATGATFRFEAEQEPYHPGNSNPAFVIEGCGGLNPGIVNLFPMDDNNPFIDIDCREVIASYDPNDKTGFPIGYDDEHFIDERTELEYLIRFQNTGTDTAFLVEILDTLSPFLNPLSVRVGASSHPYQFELLGNGVLKFTFENILLPDSTTNLEASNGFVELKIAQQPSNPIGTVIYNTAAIYFDFNEPVITNQTMHTIGEAMILDIEDLTNTPQGIDISVFPNPFVEKTNIRLDEVAFKDGLFELYNINGQLIYSSVFDTNSFEVYKNNLLPGVYPFLISLDGKASVSGKLMVL